MAFENIERRFQRWKVIMVPGAKSYESWDEMVTGENFPRKPGTNTRSTAPRRSTSR